MSKESPILVGLDIGTTKICAIVGRRDENGKLEILGMGKAESLGVSQGVVSNIDLTVDSIKKAIKNAEIDAGVQIKVVNVGVAGKHINSGQQPVTKIRPKNSEEIRLSEIETIEREMFALSLEPGTVVLHVFAQEFTIDNQAGIRHPVGMSGIKFEASCHIITGQQTALQNIRKCVEKAGLVPVDLTLEPLASAAAVLTDEEKEAGVVLVDIGGGTTDIAIFHDSMLYHTAVIAGGGNIITKDIQDAFSIIRIYAEQLKVNFGSALATENETNHVITIPGLKGHPPKEISKVVLAQVIQARMEQIIERVQQEINNTGNAHRVKAGGIVLTGGGSQMKHLKQLCEYITGYDTRIGYPNEHLGNCKSEDINSPMYSTGVGLVMASEKSFKMQEKSTNTIQEVEPEIELDDKTTQPDDPRYKEKRSKNGFFKGLISTLLDNKEDNNLS